MIAPIRRMEGIIENIKITENGDMVLTCSDKGEVVIDSSWITKSEDMCGNIRRVDVEPITRCPSLRERLEGDKTLDEKRKEFIKELKNCAKALEMDDVISSGYIEDALNNLESSFFEFKLRLDSLLEGD